MDFGFHFFVFFDQPKFKETFTVSVLGNAGEVGKNLALTRASDQLRAEKSHWWGQPEFELECKYSFVPYSNMKDPWSED